MIVLFGVIEVARALFVWNTWLKPPGGVREWRSYAR
jgi:hypothetical protein